MMLLLRAILMPGWNMMNQVNVTRETASWPDGAGRQLTERAKEVDRHVGMRIRERRVMLGLTQQQMAALIGVTYQQAHKYERGVNRISAGRLFGIAKALGVPVTFFFDGLAEGQFPELSTRQRMCLELARNFMRIENGRHQTALSQLARALAESERSGS